MALMRRRKLEEDQIPTGAGEVQVPFDRTDMEDEMGPGGGPPAPAAGGTPGLLSAAAGPPAAGLAGGLGGGLEGGNTDLLSESDLSDLGGEEFSPEDAELEEMIAALEDPNTPPEVRQMIEQQLAVAARRRLAGLGGELQV